MADETTSGWAARAEALDGLRGYFLRNVTYLALPHEDMVDIGLMSTGAFVDDFVLQHIPTTAVSWPSGIDGVLGPRPGAFPDLFWLQVVGPVDISVVARFLTVAVGKQVEPAELPQVIDWMFGVRPFHPQNFLVENATVAEACALSMVFWPEFTEYRGCVVMEWKFSRENVDRWLAEFAGDTSAVEQLVNQVHLWETVDVTGPAEQAAAAWLAHRIGSMWQKRLGEAFPDRAFVVTVSNEPTGYGPTITFKSSGA